MLPVISSIPLRQMAFGDLLSLQIYKFIGAHPGKKVYIQSNLHGAEIVGNAVIPNMLRVFETEALVDTGAVRTVVTGDMVLIGPIR